MKQLVFDFLARKESELVGRLPKQLQAELVELMAAAIVAILEARREENADGSTALDQDHTVAP